MFIWTFGAGHACWSTITDRRRRLRQALIRVATMRSRSATRDNFRKAVIFAARHADDPARYLRSLETWARGSSYVLRWCRTTAPSTAAAGDVAGRVSGSLFAMIDIPYLLCVLPGDPQ